MKRISKLLIVILGCVLFTSLAFANPQKEQKLLEKANAGDLEAMDKLAFYYSQRDKQSPENIGKAIEWYEKAAKLGFRKSQIGLGSIYVKEWGEGENFRAKNMVLGCAWWYLSRDRISSNFCDEQLNSNQMMRALWLADRLLD